jgi:hypothetical protein
MTNWVNRFVTKSLPKYIKFQVKQFERDEDDKLLANSIDTFMKGSKGQLTSIKLI